MAAAICDARVDRDQWRGDLAQRNFTQRALLEGGRGLYRPCKSDDLYLTNIALRTARYRVCVMSSMKCLLLFLIPVVLTQSTMSSSVSIPFYLLLCCHHRFISMKMWYVKICYE